MHIGNYKYGSDILVKKTKQKEKEKNHSAINALSSLLCPIFYNNNNKISLKTT